MLSKGKLHKVSVLKRNLDLQGMQMFKEKQNAKEREKIEEKMKWKETQRKNGLKWRWIETNKDKENDPSRDKEWSLVWSSWNTIWA